VRLLAVIGFFSFPLVGFIYLVMALALPTKPMPARRKGVNLRAHLDQLQQQLGNVERKVGQLESYITSDEFDFQRRVGALKRDQ
jgi:hypothetical protein